MPQARKFGCTCLLIATMALSGCVSVQMPQYVNDKNPYRREYTASYDRTLKAVVQALEKSGWKVAKQTSPMVFESGSTASSPASSEVLIFTNTRQSAMLFGSCYRTLNVLIKQRGDAADVEVRYFSIFSTIFRNFESYQNDALVQKFLDQIEQILQLP